MRHPSRTECRFELPPDWTTRLLAWADQFGTAVYLDSNSHPHRSYPTWDCLVAVDPLHILQVQAGNAFAQLLDFQNQINNDWLFGFFSYDLKNELEQLHSGHPDGIRWPDLFFFQPRIVVGIRAAEVHIFTHPNDDATVIFEQINHTPLTDHAPQKPPVVLQARLSPDEYTRRVQAIRQHIIDGDVYELNFCQEFFAESVALNPADIFRRLNARTQAPFAAYVRHEARFLMCASPERFLKKIGPKIISQPIKGTRRRSTDALEDAQIKAELAQHPKDRAENVMIVDLVRNDLARHCSPGSVVVEELFGIHTFETVHQMISTVSGTLRRPDEGLAALRDAFPMGSMTGAPKVMAMHLIEQHEEARRGLFSGAVGYFDPAGDFDFNVVIRSIQYHATPGYVSCCVGGAIVFDSDPLDEYHECLVKLAALREVLGG
jgi:para-aminobenzoate synthetase component I